ncbi:unnamed protein product [Candida verbasci]|uniref:Spore wall maturation protein DIT1 n=1 Tax=Candida verbasci TaxID=1227364 RepID=A0A9W4TTU8_9ASCO|nr:unnamed protein product [Candida verbasci]
MKSTTYKLIKQFYIKGDENYFRNYNDFNGIIDKVDEVEYFGDMKRMTAGEYFIWEVDKGNYSQGLITSQFYVTNFEIWFFKLLMSTENYFPRTNCSFDADIIVELFAKELKHTVEHDRWEEGKILFKQGVEFFTSRWQPVRAVLPAFPCKSSNIDKVASEVPDKGEELAIKRLIDFAYSVKKVYPPGVIISIVSDGHVFSDCIAVDDAKVNKYSKLLKELYYKIKPIDFNPITFSSLPEIFKLESFHLCPNVELTHYIPTQLDEESEVCRKILVATCDTDAGKLRQDILTDGHPRLALFRGFSKFMTEDLQAHSLQMTRKKYKKMVANIAFEMIKRNDAYSNLVELIFPFHLRFSIHAHNNLGPKFGISLLNNLHINNLSDKSSDLLHIPTPWHNSIVKINDVYFVIKAHKVREELKNGHEGLYKQEVKDQEEYVKGLDGYELKKQLEVLDESKRMVPEVSKKIEQHKDELKKYIEEHPDEDLKEAKELLNIY